jgi:hypothetical protein
MNNTIQWNFEADFIQACSCDYGCPCEFSAPPTQGFCEGMVAWRINSGRYGQTDLAGIGMALAVRWPKAIHEGNGTASVFVDVKASSAQRDALLQIASGKAGGLPFEILATTLTKILEPRFVPIDFEINGRNSRVRVGDAINVAMEPIKNPVTGEPESVRIEHSTGFIFKAADCVSAAEMQVGAGELNFAWPNKAGFVTQIQYRN